MVDSPQAATILIVDDEEDTLALTEAILTRRGYNVRTAADVAEAMTLLEHPPDAVLLDVMMPEMSGLDLLQYMRETPRLARVPVILLTARRRDGEVLEGYRCGADYYITKPCTEEQIEYGLRMFLADRAGAAGHR